MTIRVPIVAKFQKYVASSSVSLMQPWLVGTPKLPGAFHRDPADQMIVATARLYDCPLVTLDRLIRAYPHVRLAP